ncbi:dihydroxyacetone kinase phosphoryl donor subunit DhaM [Hutsoniella sourekii]|uniref:dihydroxyacetone kinase phosphoryl donor subunit DhaM n=1 Tax=Hutsoniella sourekii TaxID=87650 RepID=UPI0004851C27|nr:dihydroxyacetone kinase phosphoryl donor subunit DhaM [Hutsoniella sourekii]
MTSAILLVSHVDTIATGVKTLISEVASDIEILTAAGLEDGGVGTSFERIQSVVEASEADTIYAFFDLGSAKMNLEMVQEFTDKDLTIYEVALVEGAYNAAALLQAGIDKAGVEAQLEELRLNK